MKAETWSSQDWHIQACNVSTNKRHITTLILIEDQEVWVPAKLPSTATLHWNSEPSPSKLDFENQQGLHSGEPEGYRKHILHSEYTQNLTCSDSQHRGSHLKGTWVRLYLLNLKSIQKRQEVAEIKVLVVDIFGISFYCANNDIIEYSLYPINEAACNTHQQVLQQLCIIRKHKQSQGEQVLPTSGPTMASQGSASQLARLEASLKTRMPE